jgi:ATP/maltotriose-dependent transcriptional regulator MalT
MWAHELDALAYVADLQLSPAERSIRSGLAFARAAGDDRAERRMLTGLCELAFWGPMPVGSARSLCADLLPTIESDLQLTAPLLATMGALAALEGEQAAATEFIGRANRITEELDLPNTRTLLRQHHALILDIGGDHAAAAAQYLAAADEFAMLESAAATFRVMAARALLLGGDAAGARAAMNWPTDAAIPTVDPEDPYAVGLWYGVAARLAALDGDAIRAREWASMGVAMASTAENPRSHADALIDVAAVHRQIGNEAVAQTALAAARQQLIRKGATRSLELASQWAGPIPVKDGQS